MLIYYVRYLEFILVVLFPKCLFLKHVDARTLDPVVEVGAENCGKGVAVQEVVAHTQQVADSVV